MRRLGLAAVLLASALALAAGLWLFRPPTAPPPRSFEEPPAQVNAPLVATTVHVEPRREPPLPAPTPITPKDTPAEAAPAPRAPEPQVKVLESAPPDAGVRPEPVLTLAGILVDDRRIAIAGAVIVAEADGSRVHSVTDELGRFHIAGLAPVAHQLSSQPDDHALATLSGIVPPTAGLVLTAPRASTVIAYLRVPPGYPTPERVSVAFSETRETWLPWNGGRIELGGVPTGMIELRFFVEGLSPAFREFYAGPKQRMNLEEVFLYVGFVLEGWVLDPDGRPVANARVQTTNLVEQAVRFFNGWSGKSGDYKWKSETSTSSGADGSFRLEHVAEGYLALRVIAEGFLEAFPAPRVEPGRPLVLHLRRGGLLRIQVRHADERPAADVSLRIKSAESGAVAARTGEDGRCEVRLHPGAWRVSTADAREFPVELREGEETPLTLTLER